MAESIGGMVAESVNRHAQRPALKVRKGTKLEEVSYGALYNFIKEFGSGLVSLGVTPSEKIFILSDNRMEWLVSDLAILSIGAINVSRGNDSTLTEVEYILNHSQPTIIIVEDRRQLEKITSLIDRMPSVKGVIILDDPGVVNGKGNIQSYGEVLVRGKQLLSSGDKSFEDRLNRVTKECLATIVYTSGTTGPPKGVMLTHQNILSNIEATLQAIEVTSEDRFLSILPSWHMFERTVEYAILRRGASLIYTSAKTLGRDMILEKPTYFASVPRIWELFYDRISRKLKEGNVVKRTVTALLLTLGKHHTLAGRIIRHEEVRFKKKSKMSLMARTLGAWITWLVLLPAHSLGEVLIYRKVKTATGGCLNAAISGGGALPAYLDDFFETVGITVLNGYGLTETSPILTVRTLHHNIRGTIGKPITETEVKIVDEEGREVPRGEQGVIWVRGPQVMPGYYKNAEATSKVMKAGGWFDTGDLGRETLRGDLAITGRLKDTIVLLGGENVEPEPIETRLRESEYIENAMVVGQDRKYLAALIIPNRQTIGEYLKKGEGDREEIVHNPLVQELIRKEIAKRINEANGFRSYEKIIKFTLVGEDWTKENGLLTPTLKLKRNIIAHQYPNMIEKMYG